MNTVEESFPVTLTLESVSATTAIIKWTAAHASVSASSPRLLVRRLVQFDGDSAGGAEDASVRVVALDSADSDGHYHLDELIDGQMYSAQLVVDQPYYAAANISNVLYFTTPDGLFIFLHSDVFSCLRLCYFSLTSLYISKMISDHTKTIHKEHYYLLTVHNVSCLHCLRRYWCSACRANSGFVLLLLLFF